MLSLDHKMIARSGPVFQVHPDQMDDMLILGLQLEIALLKKLPVPTVDVSYNPSPEEIEAKLQRDERARVDDELNRIIRSGAAGKAKYEAKLFFSDYKAGKFDVKACQKRLSLFL